MKVTAAEFIKSAPSLKDAPDLSGSPEIVFVGRSNVGKSSLINTLINRKQLAKTSNTPGKTQLMNFYNINNRWIFVDLPGYGFAKVSKSEQEKWRKNFEAYLKEREEIALVVQLVDSRHEPQKSDLQMYGWLTHHELPVQIVLTKADKLSKNDANQSRFRATKTFQLPAENIILFSTTTKQGKDAVWDVFEEV